VAGHRVAVGEGQLLCLDQQVKPLGAEGIERPHVEAFQDVELFQQHESLRRRGRRVDGDAAVVGLDRSYIAASWRAKSSASYIAPSSARKSSRALANSPR